MWVLYIESSAKTAPHFAHVFPITDADLDVVKSMVFFFFFSLTSLFSESSVIENFLIKVIVLIF